MAVCLSRSRSSRSGKPRTRTNHERLFFPISILERPDARLHADTDTALKLGARSSGLDEPDTSTGPTTKDALQTWPRRHPKRHSWTRRRRTGTLHHEPQTQFNRAWSKERLSGSSSVSSSNRGTRTSTICSLIRGKQARERPISSCHHSLP